MITMVSAKPTGPMPVRATTSAPVPVPPRTCVPQIHSRCRDQSIATCHTRSGVAPTSTLDVISSCADMTRR